METEREFYVDHALESFGNMIKAYRLAQTGEPEWREYWNASVDFWSHSVSEWCKLANEASE